MSTRVAIVAPNYHPRTCGVGDYSMRVAQELLRRGDQARVFTRLPVEPHPEAPEVEVEGAPGPLTLPLALALARRILRWGADRVLVQYTPHMLGATRFGSAGVPALVALLKARGLPVTVVAHELYPPWARRPDLALSAANARAQLAALLRAADRVWVTTPSRRVQAERVRALLGGGASLGVVPVGANATPVPAAPRGGGFRLGVFSSLAHGKRFDVVLGAFTRVFERVPDAELFLIGDLGSRGAASASLQRAVAESPARERIHLTGKLPLAEVAALVSTMDVYLFPMDTGATTRSGTLPLALGAGVPVVAISGIETSELFRADENVVLAPSLTPEAFAEAALRLRGDRTLAERVGQGGRALYERHLTWPRITDAILGPA